MNPRWHALSVHVRSELSAAADVKKSVDEVFVPVRVERRAWSDRIQTVEMPLFPGYVFVRAALSAALRVQLLKSRHVVDLTGRLPGDERIARAIPDAEIGALQVLVRAERALDPIEKLVRGKTVLVAAGPLRGAHGVVEQGPDGQRRLVVQVRLLGRGVRTTLSADDVIESAIEVAEGAA
jgi:transcription termination/antitermination protein NusG